MITKPQQKKPFALAHPARPLRSVILGTAVLGALVAATAVATPAIADQAGARGPLSIIPAQDRAVQEFHSRPAADSDVVAAAAPTRNFVDPTGAAGADIRIIPVQGAPVMIREPIVDPLEPLNRLIFAVNDGLDLLIVRPVAQIYRAVLPGFVRKGIGNFLSNVATPVTLANDLLQGEFQRAETTMVRFLLNTTAGFGGLDDIAGRIGYERHTEDFGQTLAVYGAPAGPYIVLPILGPATPRHAVGRVVDIFANPWYWLLADEETLVRAAPGIAAVIDARANSIDSLDSIRETSPDYYVSVRSLYIQNRMSEIRNGRDTVEDLPEIPDIQ